MHRIFVSLKPALLALLIGCVPGVAHADASCDGLFSRLRQVAASGQQSYVHVLWTTNYFVKQRDALFLGTTEIILRRQQADLFGTSARTQAVYSLDRAKPVVRRSDNVSLRIMKDGRLTLNEMYGPFDPVCASNKFAIVNAGDAVEVFSLDPRRQ